MWSSAWTTLCLLLRTTVSMASVVVSTDGQREASDIYPILFHDLSADDEAFSNCLTFGRSGTKARIVTADPLYKCLKL